MCIGVSAWDGDCDEVVDGGLCRVSGIPPSTATAMEPWTGAYGGYRGRLLGRRLRWNPGRGSLEGIVDGSLDGDCDGILDGSHRGISRVSLWTATGVVWCTGLVGGVYVLLLGL